MELYFVRKELNKYDNIIKNMICLRMSLIPIVADIKIKNNIPLFQGKREEEIYNKLDKFAKENGVNHELLKNIYKLIISNALSIEEAISNDKEKSIINEQIHYSKINEVKELFEKLDYIIENEIPEILSNIKDVCNKENLNLNQISTIYYNKK